MLSSHPYSVCQLALLVTVLASAGHSVEATAAAVQTNKSSHKEALDVLQIQGCAVAVHKAPGSKSNFILEPMLCWKAGMEQLLCVGFDYLRSRHFLRVPVLLTDPAVPDKAKQLLQKLFPGSVQFMDPAGVSFQLVNLDQRVDIELEQQLMSSAGRSYLVLRVHCSAPEHCQNIRQGLATQPSLMFERLRFSLSSDAEAAALRQAVRSVSAGSLVCESQRRTAPGVVEGKGDKTIVEQPAANQSRVLEVDGLLYLLVQQRSNGGVSFQRNWTEYENGFGTPNGDFWIGLRLLHSLTKPSRVLRIEIVRFRNAAFDQDFFHAEYNDFRVGPPPLYSLSYSAFNRARSSTLGDALAESRGRGFSTLDRDNDSWPDSCSMKKGGGGGWWFSSCGVASPNGIFYSWNAGNESGIRWGYLDSLGPHRNLETLKYIRILLRL